MVLQINFFKAIPVDENHNHDFMQYILDLHQT